jgi:uncharacterized membrane protein (UPF0127 family)
MLSSSPLRPRPSIHRVHLSVLATFLVWSLASCAGQANEVRALHLGAAAFQTEVVNTPAGREHGLMGRTDLTDQMAMLFVFPDEENRIFWMKDTPTPLSIAYISKQGVVKEILDMEAFSLAPVPSKYSVPYALEVKQGAFERRGVKVGDTIPAADLTGLSASR